MRANSLFEIIWSKIKSYWEKYWDSFNKYINHMQFNESDAVCLITVEALCWLRYISAKFVLALRYILYLIGDVKGCKRWKTSGICQSE